MFWRRGGSSTWFALILFEYPFPVGRALGRCRILRGLAWGAAALVLVPIVCILWTPSIRGRRSRIGRATVRQATVLIIPPEITVLALVGHDERSEGGQDENMLEKHR